jgi:uncharacterized protein (TIGR02466 family)
MSTTLFFPTQVYSAQLPNGKLKNLIPRLKKEAYLFRQHDKKGQAWSKKNYLAGYTSYSSIQNLHEQSSNFREIKMWIDTHVGAYANALEFDLKGGRLEMTTFWINIMGKFSHHSFHIHPLSAVSGTFYLQVPKGAGSITFEDPRLDALMASPPRKSDSKIQNKNHVHLKPKPGGLVLFESWLRHQVPANASDTDRISVSFNYDWIRA